MKLRLRTKFLLSMLVITAGLTATSLLLVRWSVQKQVRTEIAADLQNSVTTFQNFQRARELTLTQSAALLADLPNLRALMTTQHEATIQDGSESLWQLAGSDLFVLADQRGRVVALHEKSPGLTRQMTQQQLSAALDPQRHWWYGAHHLYQVFLRPIYFGPDSDNHLLGYLAVGYEIDDELASQVARIAASQVAFCYGDTVVKSTLSSRDESQLARAIPQCDPARAAHSEQVQLGKERFLVSSLDLAPGSPDPIRLTVLKSYDQATAFLNQLNRLLVALGLAAVLLGSGLVFFISHTFTRPLGGLVSGVRALGRGDFKYPVDPRGSDEVAEVAGAFSRMRDSLLKTQQELLEAERLATIGRMASSVSHDLRHSLAAIVANAEFLCEGDLNSQQRDELYDEVRLAANRMTDLIDSLLEFSRTRESLRPGLASLEETIERSIHTVRMHPEFHSVQITLDSAPDIEGWFDAKRLERALFNLLLNACEAVPLQGGRVCITIQKTPGGVDICIQDNGRGIPAEVRDSLFDPFVSHGKENGTGLGLTVVQKIIQDHGGEVAVESTSAHGTVFRLHLPFLRPPTPERLAEQGPSKLTPSR